MFNDLWEARKKSSRLLPNVLLNRDATNRLKRFEKAWERTCKETSLGYKIFYDCRERQILNDNDLKIAAWKQEEYLKAQTGTISSTFPKKVEVISHT